VGSEIDRWGIFWTLRGGRDIHQMLELINGRENIGYLKRNNIGLDIEYYWYDILEFTTDVRVYWNDIHYSSNEELNQEYIMARIKSKISGYFNDQWLIDILVNHRTFNRDTFQNRKNTGTVGVSIKRLFLGKRGNIGIEVHDLFNQNQGIIFNNGATYIQEIHRESLGRYLMLKITYKPRFI